ncbi:sensor histidine kinase [Micromonospora craniellae]|uniref:Uncharacterized protein n=1 Tax=Micromonospora craniellae TaxID=2294034 RepID=A0A372FQN0_9ACTN|nr:hypothetical protein [Micromonospora craniellae]QOC92254.1 hypothetical protein ID554_00065 [Micromonospora craniellae]RFS40999.1 hypothetical protein D0Q02_29860 [Micromonospora craniellae]
MGNPPSTMDTLLGAVAQTDAELGDAFTGILNAIVGRRPASVWSRRTDGWLHRVADNGDGAIGPDRVLGVDALHSMADVAAVVPALDGEVERGAVVLFHLPGREPLSAWQRVSARDAATFVALLLRGPQLRDHLRRRIDETNQVAAALAASHERLTYAADMESRRIVAEIVSFGGDDLAGLGDQVRRMRQDRRGRAPGTSATPDEQAALAEVRGALDDLIERLRTTVRGIHPHVLYDRGMLAALVELAASLPRAVQVHGDPGGGMAREVETSLYWAAAEVLRALADEAAPGRPVTVRLQVPDGEAVVTVADPGAATLDKLRSVLPAAYDRLTALGGSLAHRTGPDGVTVYLRLPTHLAPSAPPRVVTGCRTAVKSGHTGTPVDLVSRVRGLVHAAVEVVEEDERRRLGQVLRLIEGTGAVAEPAPAPPLAGVAEAFAVLDAVTRRDPEGWLRYEYERVRASAHEVNEQMLAHEIRSGTLSMDAPTAVDALRLLGENGTAIPTRLGLAEAATSDEQRVAALRQVARWRGWASSPASGPRAQAAGRLLARSAEGLVARLGQLSRSP